MPPYEVDRDPARDQSPHQPEAQELVEHSRVRLLKFRDSCRHRISELEEAIEFWRKEMLIVSEFLSDDQLNRTTEAKPERAMEREY